jgi:hypothetical protein
LHDGEREYTRDQTQGQKQIISLNTTRDFSRNDFRDFLKNKTPRQTKKTASIEDQVKHNVLVTWRMDNAPTKSSQVSFWKNISNRNEYLLDAW